MYECIFGDLEYLMAVDQKRSSRQVNHSRTLTDATVSSVHQRSRNTLFQVVSASQWPQLRFFNSLMADSAMCSFNGDSTGPAYLSTLLHNYVMLAQSRSLEKVSARRTWPPSLFPHSILLTASSSLRPKYNQSPYQAHVLQLIY